MIKLCLKFEKKDLTATVNVEMFLRKIKSLKKILIEDNAKRKHASAEMIFKVQKCMPLHNLLNY